MPGPVVFYARRAAFCLFLLAVALAPGAASAGGKKTHLGVPVNQIVNLQTENIPNDNAGGAAAPPAFFLVANACRPGLKPRPYMCHRSGRPQ